MKNPLKIVLVSDNHGFAEPLEYVREAHKDCDYFIHCGDAEMPAYLLEGFAVVQGNNDFYNQFPPRKVLHIGKHTILVVHGHRDMIMGRYEMLVGAAARYGADIVFFGHTHVPLEVEYEGVHLLNPGSIWHNRDGSQPSYYIVTLDEDKVSAERMTYTRQMSSGTKKKK